MKDKAERIEKHLKEIVEKFKDLKQSGVDEELLIVYIMAKTKLSRKDVKAMLEATEDFYNKLMCKLTAEAL